MGLYVYAFTQAGHPLPAGQPGVGSPPATVGLIDGGRGLTAVVSEAPDGLRARRRDLLAHHNLLLALAESGPVLPMRFGMVAPDADAVRARLADAEASGGCASALERLDGRCEMNVKVQPAQDRLADLLREDAHVRRLREEVRRSPGYEANVRLGEAVASALNRRAAEVAGAAMRAFGDLAEDAVRGPEVPGSVLNASFLVPSGRQEQFRAAVERFAAEHRDRIELTVAGPLPCYSFVPSDAAMAEA